MADISKIKLPNGTTYNIKDTISGYTTNTGTVTTVTAGIGLTGGSISTSGTIALDTTRAITASDIATGTDTTNKLISAKVLSDALAGAGGSYTATSPVDITNYDISLVDSYGDIKNPYGSKNEHYVLAGTPNLINLQQVNLNGEIQGEIYTAGDVLDEKLLQSGTYNLTGTVTFYTYGASEYTSEVTNIISFAIVDSNGTTIKETDQITFYTNPTGGQTDANINETFTLEADTVVKICLVYMASSESICQFETVFNNGELSSNNPALPTFRALTAEDLPNGAINSWFGTCSTTASTNVKVVVCDNYTPYKGSIIGVLFSNSNTSNAALSLNVNSTGAKSVYVGTSTTNGTTNVLKWGGGSVVYFMYDGSYYRYITSVSQAGTTPSRGANTWFGTSSTAATTNAKTSTITNFVLTPGAVVYIAFSTANTYTSGALTLNVNSTGAKTIYYNNAATSSTNTLLWNAKETLVFVYSGSYWYFAGKSTNATSGGITDVQVNGSTVVSNNVANIQLKTIGGTSVVGTGDISVYNSFKVTLSYDDATSTYTTDKTYAEILTAYNAGKFVYLYNPTTKPSQQNGEIVAPLTAVDVNNEVIRFEGFIDFELITYTVASSFCDVSTSSFAVDNHIHGNITADGDITVNSTIASGDRLVINDESANALANSSITFGTNTTQFLANNGTWQSLYDEALATTGGQITGDLTLYTPSGNSPGIIFQRGTLTDNYNDWKIYDKSGFLYFAQRGSGSSSFNDMGYISTTGVLTNFTIPWGSVTGKPAQLPTVTTSDNGKVLRVVNGAWSAVQLPSASGVSF